MQLSISHVGLLSTHLLPEQYLVIATHGSEVNIGASEQNIVSENKPPSSFHSCLVGFTGTLNLLTHLRYYFLISSHTGPC